MKKISKFGLFLALSFSLPSISLTQTTDPFLSTRAMYISSCNTNLSKKVSKNVVCVAFHKTALTLNRSRFEGISVKSKFKARKPFEIIAPLPGSTSNNLSVKVDLGNAPLRTAPGQLTLPQNVPVRLNDQLPTCEVNGNFSLAYEGELKNQNVSVFGIQTLPLVLQGEPKYKVVE